MKEQDELIALVNEKDAFLEENKSVFAKIEEYDMNISNLTATISNKLINEIPELISKLTGDDVNFLFDLQYDIDDEDLLNELKEEVEAEDDERYRKYRQRELDLTISLKGWEVSSDDEANGAVNDGDYFDVSLTITSPEGIAYSVEDETCLAVCPNFPDDLSWRASM